MPLKFVQEQCQLQDKEDPVFLCLPAGQSLQRQQEDADAPGTTLETLHAQICKTVQFLSGWVQWVEITEWPSNIPVLSGIYE